MKKMFTMLLIILVFTLISAGTASATVTGDAPGGDLAVDAEAYTITGDHQNTNGYNSITVANGGILYIQPDDVIDGAEIDVATAVTITGNSAIVPKSYYTISTSPDYNGQGVNINAVDFQIDQGSSFNAAGQGYAAGSGPGVGNAFGNNPTVSGAGYGGYGGYGVWVNPTPYYYALPGLPYGSSINPIDLGSGGRNYGGYSGGAGGGAVKLVASGTLVNNGQIVANGFNGGYNSSGGTSGGSGGSIWIDAGTLGGSGSISANGGAGVYDPCYSCGSWCSTGSKQGGGSGGRVAVYYRDNKTGWNGSISANGGNAYSSGDIGTSLLQVANPDLNSSSHEVDAWSNNNSISIALSNVASGIDGYGVLWSQDNPQDPLEEINLQADATSTTSEPLGDGIWYFNIRTEETSGTWTISENLGPFKIDTVVPTGAISISQEAGYVNTTTVSLDLSDATDTGAASGVDKVMLSEDPSFASCSWEDYSPSTTYDLYAGDGTKTVYAKFKDLAGNESSVVSDSVILDTTVPETTSALTSTQGQNGWHTSDVTVTLLATDNLSGVDQTFYRINGGLWNIYSLPILFSTEGTVTVESYSVDNAGNVEAPNEQVVQIDKTAPQTSADLSGTDGDNGWYVSDVNLTFDVTDNFSGAADTEYSFDNATWNTYDSTLTITAEGTTTIYYRSTDSAGNVEGINEQAFKMDKTGPTITGAPTSEANANGWYNSDVLVSFAASDSLSGLAGVTPDTTLTTEGANRQMIGTATDNAGNSSDYTVTGINIDKTSAQTTAGLNGTAGDNGWYTSDVTVTLSGTDNAGGSGVALTEYSFDDILWNNYTGPLTLVSEGTTTVYYRSTDNAGNVEATNIETILIDKTSAQTTVGLNGTAGDNGWYTSDVTVTLTGADSTGSGVALTEYSFDDILWNNYTGPLTLTNEGTTTVYYRSTDNADNLEATNSETILIDKTPPPISGAPTTPPNANGWYATDVTVHFDAGDAMSGLASVTANTIVSSEGVNQQVIGTATDNAGNSADFTVTGINIDKTSAQTTAGLNGTAGDNGWYTSDVTVTLSGTDNAGGSGVALTEYSFDDILWNNYTGPLTLVSEGTTTVYYRSTDNAGNMEATKNQIVLIDKTAPTVSITSPVDGAEYLLNEVAIAGWSASDAVSGIASATGDAGSGQPIDTSRPGLNTFTVAATDIAGNPTTEAATYYVRYDYGGILQPIEADGSSLFTIRSEGSVVQVKFQLRDANGDFAADAVASIAVTQTSEETSGNTHESIVDEPVTPGVNFLYDNATNEYYFNQDTDLLEEGTSEIRIDLDDGTSKYVTISLK